MTTTDLSEKNLESIIVASLTDEAGYLQGNNSGYDRDHAMDIELLSRFIGESQPEAFNRQNCGT